MLLVLALKIKKIEGGKAARAGTRQLAAFFFFFFFLLLPCQPQKIHQRLFLTSLAIFYPLPLHCVLPSTLPNGQ